MTRWHQMDPRYIKGYWTPEVFILVNNFNRSTTVTIIIILLYQEDEILSRLVKNARGDPKWPDVAARIPGRSSKQCRERWKTGIQPTINRSEFTLAEDEIILRVRPNFFFYFNN